MTREQSLRAAALDMLRRLEALDKKHAAYMDALRELQPDIGVVTPLPDGLETDLVNLIDLILGEDLLDDGEGIAAYLRLEAWMICGGGAVTINGRKYPIRTVDDVAAYLDAEHPLDG